MCTGLEPLLVSGLGLTAGAASTAALATGLGAAGAGLLGSKLLTPKVQTPVVTTPEKPPQATKAPDRSVFQAANMAAARGAFAGNAGTFLTGPSGIDAGTLSLGRNTLLGQ